MLAKATAEQLKLINKFAKEPLTEENTYVHGFRLIGTRLITDRYLKLDKSLLDVYLQDILNGDVVQIADHTLGGIKSWFNLTLPFGRFFDGRLVEDGDITHLDGWMYMKAGQKTYVEPFTTDDISEQLDAGTLDDSSVGIAWDVSECSICGNDIRDYENCQHWPGKTYKVNGKELLCYVIAKPAPGELSRAYMAENSLVGVGAYPDAGHLSKDGLGPPEKGKYQKVNTMMELKLVPKEEPVFCLFSAGSAEILIESGQEPDAARSHDMCHMMYKDGLPAGMSMRQLTQKHTETVEKLIMDQEHYLEDALDGTLPGQLKAKSKRKEETHLDAKIIEMLTSLGITYKEGETTPEELSVQLAEKLQALKNSATQFMTEEQVAEALGKELTADTILKLAKDGEAFRKEVIEEALAAGVRAQGNDFPAETWKNTFASMSINAIRDIAKTFQKQSEDAIPAGRKTDPGVGKTGHQQNIPDEVFKV